MRIKGAVAMFFLTIFALSSIVMVPILPSKADGGTQLYIDPLVVNRTPSDIGTTFVMNVTLGNFANLAGFDINLTWDSSLITETGVDYNTTLNTLWGAGNWAKVFEQSGAGFYELAVVALATSASNTGASVLFTKTFHVDRSSDVLLSTPIHFAFVKLSDNATPIPNSIPATVTDGMYIMSPTSVQVEPANSTGYFGEAYSINITITDVTNLTGWAFKLFYLNSILNCTAVTMGPFLSSVGGTFQVIDILNNFNSTYGRILAVCALVGTNACANGSGVLATVTFNATALGGTALHLGDTTLNDNQTPSQPIPHVTVDGTADVILRPEQVLDVCTQRGGTGPNKPSDAFAPSETVLFNASVQYHKVPIPGIIVQFITYDPHGTPTARTAVTGADGIATSNITLPSNPPFGNYTTVASATINGNGYNDTVTFQVGWIINILQVVACNSSGGAETQFVRGTLAYMNITVEDISFNPKQLFMLVQANDAYGATVAHEWIRCTVPSGKTTILMGFRVPPWVTIGVGQTFAGAYDNPPWAGGIPWCPGNYLSISITGG